MKIFIDTDGCPVTDIAVKIAVKRGVECTRICNTAHSIYRDGVETITVCIGADSLAATEMSLFSYKIHRISPSG